MKRPRNVLLDAISPALTEDQIIEKVYKRSEKISAFRKLSRVARVEILEEEESELFVSTPDYLSVITNAQRMIRRGYKLRPDIAMWPQKTVYGPDEPRPSGKEFCGAYIGPIGTGKSSLGASLEVLYSAYIDHSTRGDTRTRTIQFPVIRIDCPDSASTRDLPQLICRAIATRYRQSFKEELWIPAHGSTWSSLISEAHRLCTTFGVGLIIIDNFERFKKAKSKASLHVLRKLIDKMLEARTRIDVPFLFLGNYTALDLLMADSRSGRRLAHGAVVVSVLPNSSEDEQFNFLLEEMWNGMLLRKNGRLTPTLRQLIFELTGGIPDYMDLLLKGAQIAALNEGLESLNRDHLDDSFETGFLTLRGQIAALKTRDPAALANYSDLYNGYFQETSDAPFFSNGKNKRNIK